MKAYLNRNDEALMMIKDPNIMLFICNWLNLERVNLSLTSNWIIRASGTSANVKEAIAEKMQTCQVSGELILPAGKAWQSSPLLQLSREPSAIYAWPLLTEVISQLYGHVLLTIHHNLNCPNYRRLTLHTL